MMQNHALPFRGLIASLSAFTGSSALAGGTELVLYPSGNRYVPIELLDGTTFDTFFIPGLLLGGVVGGTSLTCTILALLRARLAPWSAILAGGTLAVWIVAEFAQLHEASWLQAAYGALGVILFALGLWAQTRMRASAARQSSAHQH